MVVPAVLEVSFMLNGISDEHLSRLCQMAERARVEGWMDGGNARKEGEEVGRWEEDEADSLAKCPRGRQFLLSLSLSLSDTSDSLSYLQLRHSRLPLPTRREGEIRSACREESAEKKKKRRRHSSVVATSLSADAAAGAAAAPTPSQQRPRRPTRGAGPEPRKSAAWRKRKSLLGEATSEKSEEAIRVTE